MTVYEKKDAAKFLRLLKHKLELNEKITDEDIENLIMVSTIIEIELREAKINWR